jgi:hypothetical protein
MPEPQPRYFPIRLAYLWDSEHNTVDWAWDAYDDKGAYYYITARRGILLISREGEVVHESIFGDECDSKLSLNALWELAGPLQLFDRSLLDDGRACVCGYTYEKSDVPEFCRRCEARVRGRRLVELYAGDANSEGDGSDLEWRFVDEYARDGVLSWQRGIVDIAAEAAGAAPAYKARFAIGTRHDRLEGPDDILFHISMNLLMELDFAALECARCTKICLSDQKECPACGATKRGPQKAQT